MKHHQGYRFIILVAISFSSLLFATDAQERYFIKEGYISRTVNSRFDDTGNEDGYQDEVYFAASAIVAKNRYTKIGDIGCGSGFKLMKYFQDCETVGFEIPPTLNFLLKKYPNRQWEESDFKQSLAQREFDLLICADVIEHLIDPNQLLKWIQKCNFEVLVISTPDRDRLLQVQNNNPQSQTGPPVNPAHVREWSFDEFASYIGQYFDIVSHFHTEKEFWGQVIVAKKKHSNSDYYKRIGRKKDGYYSQCGQDRLLNDMWFKNKKNGVFVDIGAHNGISYSNTKFFEELGWKGLCIEPIPEVFEELKKNRSCICVQGCVCDYNGKGSFLRVEGEPEMLSGLLSKYDRRHLQRVKDEVAARSFGKAPKCIEVQCYLLNDLLRENKIFHIDYLSIDTEGGELDILKTIDFDRFDIEFIDVENNFKDQKIIGFLSSKGYKLIANTGWDDIFKKERPK